MVIRTEESREFKEITSAIEEGFGVFPNFFTVASDSPPVVAHLFTQARFAYVQAPFPPRFKEELFAYLSRFCMVPYCLLRHTAFLLQCPASENTEEKLSPADVLEILQAPLPGFEQFAGHLDVLSNAVSQPPEAWVRGSEVERAVFFGGVSLFMRKGPVLEFQAELRRFLGSKSYLHFCTFLSFIRTAHFWTELHETLSIESDVEELLCEEPALGHWMQNYRENVSHESGVDAESVIAELTLAFRDSEAKRAGLNQIVETSLNEIYIFSAETLRFVEVNEVARRNLGYTIEELRALTPLDIESEYTPERFRALLNPLRSGGQMPKYTTRHVRKDGSVYPVEAHLQYVSLEGASVFVAIALDTTEKKRAEKALLESHELLEQRVLERTAELRASQQSLELALSAGQLGTFVHDLKTDRVEVTPTYNMNPGRSDDSGHISDWTSALHPDDLPRFLDKFKLLKEAGEDLADEYRTIQPDGSIRWIKVRARGIKDDRGEVERVYGVLDDTTEARRFTDSLEEAKSLAERATAAKSRFLMAASHDLRQPLQALNMYLFTLTHQIDQPRLRECAEHMRNALDTMGDLLNALLDISKFEGGSVTPEKQNLHLRGLLQRIVANNIQQAENKGLQLECTGADCVVYSDPALLERVIDNFVSNAIRYTQRGCVTIHFQRTGTVVRISVTDTGVGMTADVIENVFDEYYQLDNPARDRLKGLGLGLSIVNHIARLLNHPLDVTSVPGEGSTFTVEVPLGSDHAEQSESSTPFGTTSFGSSQPSILVVDDDPAIVESARTLLESVGARVSVAGNDVEALALLEDNACPDIIVSDYWLPGRSGLELIRLIREKTDSEIPAVVITGDMSVHRVEEADLSNCTVLHKPIDVDRLISMIENLAV